MNKDSPQTIQAVTEAENKENEKTQRIDYAAVTRNISRLHASYSQREVLWY